MMENKEKNFVSAVLYVHNQELYLADFLRKINTILRENFENYEIICVDDRSTDKSVQVIAEFAKSLEEASASILHMSYYQGVELSMNAGMDLAIGDFVLEFDKVSCDFPDELLMQIYRTSLEGFDIVSAAPERAERWTSRLFYQVYNRAAGKRAMLRTETFRILSRRAVNRVHSMCQSIPYRKAVYANCGLQIKTLTYKPQERKGVMLPEEKEMRRDMAFNSLILFTNLGYQVSSLLAGMMMLAALFIGLYTIVIFVGAKPVEGWTTTMLFLSLAFFGVFAIFAIIIKYLSILIDLVFTKQQYAIEGIEKLK
ncbi:MAG: glycosyltransferase [Lachnospiraceae bacterium]|jgi:dolichol-phosphate mannosyltransferase|nr:glycosyltransferase [Lachnospiraceae bacterium]